MRITVISPFRRSGFRRAISDQYPATEPWDSAALVFVAALKNGGHDVNYLALQNILDSWNPQSHAVLFDEMFKEPSDVVLFASDDYIPSRSTATIFGMKIVCSRVRALHPNTIFVATGRLCTADPGGVMREVPELDYILVGEWATSISQFIGARNMSRQNTALVKSTETLRSDGLDATPIPDWDALKVSISWFERLHKSYGGPIPLSIRSSAGCKFACRFCAGVPYWRNYKMKSAERVSAELRAIRRDLGERARVVFLEDELFTLNEAHAMSVSRALEDHGVYLEGLYTHSSLLRGPVVSILKDVTASVYLGMDNSVDRVLKGMRKGQTLSRMLDAIERARREGLAVHLEWIVGSPEETLEDALTNLHSMFVLAASGMVSGINTYTYCPHPGTEYTRDANELGMRICGGWEEMQESGGYPTAETTWLTRQQSFVLYLISHLMLAEVAKARSGGYALIGSSIPNLSELRDLLSHFGNGGAYRGWH